MIVCPKYHILYVSIPIDPMCIATYIYIYIYITGFQYYVTCKLLWYLNTVNYTLGGQHFPNKKWFENLLEWPQWEV